MNRKHLFEIFCDIINGVIVTVNHFNEYEYWIWVYEYFYLTDPNLFNARVSIESNKNKVKKTAHSQPIKKPILTKSI